MKYSRSWRIVFLSLCSACFSPHTTQALSENTAPSDADQRNLVVSYSRLLNAFFMEPKCHLMTKEEFNNFYMYTEVSTAALVKYNIISASDMDKIVKQRIDESANQTCDSKTVSDIEFAKENAEDVARQIKVGIGKDDQWNGEGLYTLLNAIARVNYKSLMGAWHIENKCKFLTPAQNGVWQEQTARMTKQFLDQKYLKEDEIKNAQQEAYVVSKGYSCDEKSKSIVSDAFRASTLSIEPTKQ